MSNDWRPAGLLNRPSHHASPWSGQSHDNFGSSNNTWSISNAQDKSTGTMRDRYEALKGYFGEVKQARKMDLMNESYEKENSDYPEAFARLYGGGEDGAFDRNGHLERVMIEKTMASKNLYLSRMAPWKLHEGSLTFDWSKTLFTETMLDRLPEESVPRLMSSRATSGRTSMLRYGIALLLEATFAETPQGRQTYIMNLEQMRVACVQTASYGVIVSIMEHQPYVDTLRRGYMQDGKREKDFEQIDRDIQDEIDKFGVMHKERDGVTKVLSEMRKILTNRGKVGNLSMFPQGSPIFAAELESENKFMVTGHATSADVDRSFTKGVTCEAHAFNMGDEEPGHDPMFRHRTIGAFATLDDLEVRDNDVAEYRTRQMDSLMYDQSLDEFFMAKYAHGYKYTGVWNFRAHDAPLTPDLGRPTMYDYGCYTWGQLLRKCTNSSERAVNKIFALPEDKRQAFVDSLRTLHRDSPLVNLRGAPFPGAMDFSVIHFDLMDSGAEEVFDQERPTVLISVPEHLAVRQTEGSFTARDIAVRDAYKSKRKLQVEEEDEDQLTNKQLFDRNADMEVDVDGQVADRYERVDDDHVALIPGTSDVQTRKIRRKFNHLGSGDAPQLVNLAALATHAESFVPANEPHTDACKAVVAQFCESVMKMEASEAQKASLLRELARVVKGSVYTIRFAARDTAIREAQKIKDDLSAALATKQGTVKAQTLTKAIVDGFGAFAARIDLRAAIENNKERRELDDKCMNDASISLGQSFDAKLVTPYWWSPDGSATLGDGQVRLRALGGKCPTIALPSDAFASTLAVEHLVLFDIEESDTARLTMRFDPKFGADSRRRTRLDPLAWSIALSVLSKAGGGGLTEPFPSAATRLSLPQLMAEAAEASGADGAAAAAECAEQLKKITAAAPFNVRHFLEQATPEALTMLKRQAKRRLENVAVVPPVLVCQQQHQPLIHALDQMLLKGLQMHVASKGAAWNLGLHPDPLANAVTSPSLGSAYASPVQIDVEALALHSQQQQGSGSKRKLNQEQQAALMADVAPANADAAGFTWSKTCIAELIDRASVSSGLFLSFCVDNDIPVPFCLRVWRANKTFNVRFSQTNS